MNIISNDAIIQYNIRKNNAQRCLYHCLQLYLHNNDNNKNEIQLNDFVDEFVNTLSYNDIYDIISIFGFNDIHQSVMKYYLDVLQTFEHVNIKNMHYDVFDIQKTIARTILEKFIQHSDFHI